MYMYIGHTVFSPGKEYQRDGNLHKNTINVHYNDPPDPSVAPGVTHKPRCAKVLLHDKLSKVIQV